MKLLEIVLNIILIIVCFVHITINLINYLNPVVPNVRHYEKDIGDMEFPLDIKLCLSINDSMFHSLGYFDSYELFLGKSKFNKTIFGWSGHTEDGSTLASVQGSWLFRFQNFSRFWHNFLRNSEQCLNVVETNIEENACNNKCKQEQTRGGEF